METFKILETTLKIYEKTFNRNAKPLKIIDFCYSIVVLLRLLWLWLWRQQCLLTAKGLSRPRQLAGRLAGAAWLASRWPIGRQGLLPTQLASQPSTASKPASQPRPASQPAV